jgi:Flp pilus assembly protein TadD
VGIGGSVAAKATLVIAASALFALAAWPFFIANRSDEARAERTPAGAVAPLRDDQRRDATISFWEGAFREHHRNDMMSPRILAGEYLQRYRETGDIDDVVRAKSMALRSLAIQPRNIAALVDLAAIMLTLHRFREALHDIDGVLPYDPSNPAFLAQRASLQMELGEYDAARATLARIPPSASNDPAAETVRARYDELTGHVGAARRLLAAATATSDADDTTGAQPRAWYHFRAGELDFESGDNAGAIREERAALRIFPTYNLALKDLAKFELANGDDVAALDAATRGAAITPFPETLGYEADAALALGDAKRAAAVRDTIFAIERIGNAYGVNDRLLAIYYADHRLRPQDALKIARREARLRGDEIYAQDTLAWAAAMAGQWVEARRAIGAALRHGSADPLLSYHAAVIALHFGRAAEGRRELARALALNPHFHPVFADDARARLAALSRRPPERSVAAN